MKLLIILSLVFNLISTQTYAKSTKMYLKGLDVYTKYRAHPLKLTQNTKNTKDKMFFEKIIKKYNIKKLPRIKKVIGKDQFVINYKNAVLEFNEKLAKKNLVILNGKKLKIEKSLSAKEIVLKVSKHLKKYPKQASLFSNPFIQTAYASEGRDLATLVAMVVGMGIFYAAINNRESIDYSADNSPAPAPQPTPSPTPDPVPTFTPSPPVIEFTDIAIYPEHVGIFTSVGSQQFTAFIKTDTNTMKNITREVQWNSSNESAITIDASGYATVVSGQTSGQARITGTYTPTDTTNVFKGSTTATIVNVTEFRKGSRDVTKFEDSWPASADTSFTPQGQEVYLNGVHTTYSQLSWKTRPQITPYKVYPNTINSMITAVWSEDGGQTFKLQSWDWLGNNTHSKHTSPQNPVPDCWVGTMVTTVFDSRTTDENGNGKHRSNLYFSPFPTGNNSCWGVLQHNSN